MARYRGTTTQRGLGHAHQADKKRLRAQLRDGDPCWRCGQPMYKWQDLDRDHIIDRALGGVTGPAVLAHSSCNRSAGSRLGNQIQPRTIMAAGRDTTCATCGQAYHYAARTCEICQAHYHPSRGDQRTCGRACGVKLRRKIYGPSGSSRAAKQKPTPIPRVPAEPYTPRSTVAYYTCRYCGELGVTTARGQTREVCPARSCQLARLTANRLIARNGLTREEADERATAVIASIRIRRPQ